MPEKDLDYEYPNMLKFILACEGGYVNRKTDRGGPTNKGITQVTYNSYRRSKDLPTKDVRDIAHQEVEDIYYNNYYKIRDYANRLGVNYSRYVDDLTFSCDDKYLIFLNLC